MFEQSLYDTEPVYAAEPTAEGDLFHNYELKTWDLGPRIYKIFAIAGAANIIALLVVAQTPLLTMKGCDSPLVSNVCQALDTLVVGAQIFGTERDYLDAAYEKTSLGDVDVTFVDVSGEVPPLSYPEGYFNLANPERLMQASVEQPADPFGMPLTSGTYPSGVPITPPSSGNSMLNTRPVKPKHNNDLIDGELPGAIGETKPSDKPGKGKPGASPDPSPSPRDTTAENPKVDPLPPAGEIQINKRPFTLLADIINAKIDAKQLDLSTPFLVEGKGKLTPEGKFDPTSFKYLKEQSKDPRMIAAVRSAIEAMNDSGFFQYLQMFNAGEVHFVIQQDDYNVTAMVETGFASETRAGTMTGLLKAYIDKKKSEKEGPDASENDKFDLALLQNAAASTAGKKMVVSLTMPKGTIQPLIERKLAEQKAAPKELNNNVSGRTADNTAKN